MPSDAHKGEGCPLDAHAKRLQAQGTCREAAGPRYIAQALLGFCLLVLAYKPNVLIDWINLTAEDEKDRRGRGCQLGEHRCTTCGLSECWGVLWSRITGWECS